MKVGDKVKVLETGRIGWIIGENAKGWKIDFLDGDKVEYVLKTVAMEIVKVPDNPNPTPNPRPKEKKKWLLIAVLTLLIAVAVALTIYNVLQ